VTLVYECVGLRIVDKPKAAVIRRIGAPATRLTRESALFDKDDFGKLYAVVYKVRRPVEDLFGLVHRQIGRGFATGAHVQ